jgi:hypothetical protein
MSLNRSGVIAWWRCRFGVVGADSRGTRPCTELQSRCVAEAFWNVAPQWVIVPYAKRILPPIGFPE